MKINKKPNKLCFSYSNLWLWFLGWLMYTQHTHNAPYRIPHLCLMRLVGHLRRYNIFYSSSLLEIWAARCVDKCVALLFFPTGSHAVREQGQLLCKWGEHRCWYHHSVSPLTGCVTSLPVYRQDPCVGGGLLMMWALQTLSSWTDNWAE